MCRLLDAGLGFLFFVPSVLLVSRYAAYCRVCKALIGFLPSLANFSVPLLCIPCFHHDNPFSRASTICPILWVVSGCQKVKRVCSGLSVNRFVAGGAREMSRCLFVPNASSSLDC